MSKVLKPAQAGSVESSDILITLTPAEPGAGISVKLTSPTMQQFGAHIKNLIIKTLVSVGISDVNVQANEKGALDCTIEARVKTAAKRALV